MSLIAHQRIVESFTFKPAFCYREQGESQAVTLHVNLALGSWLVCCSRWLSVALINIGLPTWEKSVYSNLHFWVIVHHSGKSGQEFKQKQRQKPQRKLLPGSCSAGFHVSSCLGQHSVCGGWPFHFNQENNQGQDHTPA